MMLPLPDNALALHRTIVTGLFLLTVAGCQSDPRPAPYPVSPQGEVVDDYHGTAVPDPYRWLETLESDETRNWISAQNAVTEPYLDALPTRGYFVDRLRELAGSSSPAVPQWRDGSWVTREYAPDGTSTLFIRDSLEGTAVIQLALQALGDAPDVDVRTVRLSPDARYLAYSIAPGGADLTEVRIRDLETNRDLDDRVPGINLDAFFWTAGSDALVYARYLRPGTDTVDAVDRDGVVGVHRIGTPVALDRVLHRASTAEGDAIPIVQLSRDRRFVLIRDYLGFDSRVWIQDLQDPAQPRFETSPRPWGTERSGQTVLLGSDGPTLYLHTNRGADNFQVVGVDGTDPTAWRTVIPESEHLLQEAIVVGGQLVAHHRRDVASALTVHGTDGAPIREIALPGIGSVFGLSGDPTSPTLTFGFDGYTHPAAVFQYDLTSDRTAPHGESTLKIPSRDYVTRQVFYASKDGTRVPMFLTSRADRVEDAPNPTLLFGYGSAGHVEEPIFTEEWFAWIDAGGTLAVANIRGGGEYGEAWRTAGTGANKQNSFDDFIAAAEYLIGEGHTTAGQLAINGASDGGLLVGAVMTQRPELFAAALPDVGVLDLLRTTEFAYGPLYARWAGDPSVPAEFARLHAISPLHALRDGTCYPATLVTTAVNDDRVHPSQSYKFSARLQAAQGCDRPTVLRAYPSGGHHGGIDTEDRIQRSANLLSFAAHHTGLRVRRR